MVDSGEDDTSGVVVSSAFDVVVVITTREVVSSKLKSGCSVGLLATASD